MKEHSQTKQITGAHVSDREIIKLHNLGCVWVLGGEALQRALDYLYVRRQGSPVSCRGSGIHDPQQPRGCSSSRSKS